MLEKQKPETTKNVKKEADAVLVYRVEDPYRRTSGIWSQKDHSLSHVVKNRKVYKIKTK